MSKRSMWQTLCGLAALTAQAASASEPERWQLNMPVGVTQTAHNAYSMHMIMLWICVVIGVIVFGAMAVAMVKFRKSRGAVADKGFTHSTVLEVIWTALPVLILVGMAIPATSRVIAQYDTSDAAVEIKVTGYQWMWRYEYREIEGQPDGFAFVSRLARSSDLMRQSGQVPTEAELPHYLREVDNELVIPAGTRVRFVFNSDDVIHAWWVPALGWKQDAIPGIINEAWTQVDEPGVYRGVCAELCGKDHGFMPIVVRVVPREQFPAELEALKQRVAAQQGEAAPVAASPAPAAAAPLARSAE
jgi:cytochrome c oxidase subunit 2